MSVLSDFEQLASLVSTGAWSAGKVIGFWQPIAPIPTLLAPLTALAAALAAALLAGIAIGSLGLLIVAILALEYLLVEVLGLTIDSIVITEPIR